MPLKTRLDRIITLIQNGHDRERESRQAEEGEARPFNQQHHRVRLLEDETATDADDEEEDHWAEGDSHVVRAHPWRPPRPGEQKVGGLSAC
jgi:hypothetical protein